MFLTKSNKSPFYQVAYERDGLRTTVSTRTADYKKAQIFLENFIIPADEPKEKKLKSIRLSSFEREYIAFKAAAYSNSYVERAIKPSFKHFKASVGDLPLQSINSRRVDNFISKRFTISASAASLYYRTLKAAFAKAIVWNYLKENPFNNIKPPKIPKCFPVFISEEEFQLIIQKTNREEMRYIFSLAYYTGMRLSEILNLKWSSVNLQKRIITVNNSATFTTKSKKERVIPINQKLLPILSSLVPKIRSLKADYVFCKCPAIKYNNNFVSKQFKKSVRAANLNDDIHFHSLRHSTASNLIQKGVSIYVVKELLGHEDIKTTQIYSHLTPEHLSNAVNLL